MMVPVVEELRTLGEDRALPTPGKESTGTDHGLGPGPLGKTAIQHTGPAERTRAGGDITKKTAYRHDDIGIIGIVADTVMKGETLKGHTKNDRIGAKNTGGGMPGAAPVLTHWTTSSVRRPLRL